MPPKPAECLKGMELEGGWKVLEIIKPAPNATGGNFSVGYLVQDRKGREAYLKALDFSGAFQATDFTIALQAMTEAYNFETNLLIKCKNHRLSRIVTPIDYGEAAVTGFGHFGKVCYLIFEKAEGDIRQQSRHLQNFELAWCLRSLHNTAVGLKQLHSRWIAHQDLKPSNILVFKHTGTMISDLGRASDKSMESPFDNHPIPGDMGYAPIELFYGFKASDEFKTRFGIDMYLLGSLIFLALLPKVYLIKDRFHMKS